MSDPGDAEKPQNGAEGTGLESHLRGMILTNKANPSRQITSEHEGQDASDHAQHVSPQKTATHDLNSKNSRRRPNQAQRRQMSSQLSVDFDPRAPDAQYRYVDAHQPQHGGLSFGGRHVRGNADNHPIPYSNRHNAYGQGIDNRHPNLGASNQPFLPSAQSRSRSHQASLSIPNSHQLPYSNRSHWTPEELARAARVLDDLAYSVMVGSEIERSEIAEKEAFRQKLERLSQYVISQHEDTLARSHPFDSSSVELKCFGSLASGFATKASDMDLGLISPMSSIDPSATSSPIPRLLENALLDAGIGARLLSRTRVPIIKLCERPPVELYQSLLAERVKWEGGETSPEQIVNAPDGMAKTELEAAQPDEVDKHLSSSLNSFQVPCIGKDDCQSFHLEQTSAKTISAYYGLAKRLLRRAEGRDVNNANQSELSAVEWDILNSFCEAFVAGLDDSNLRQRLCQYPFSSPQVRDRHPTRRSLHAMFLVAEGEESLLAWETSSVRRVFHQTTRESTIAVKHWTDLLRKDTFDKDPAAFAKDVQVQLDRVRRIPSIQLANLRQAQHETPLQYLSRTTEALKSLPKAQQSPAVALEEVAAQQYAAGIRQAEIRQSVVEILTGNTPPQPLITAARRHASLHLAEELEAAVAAELYPQDSMTVIRAYIEILRRPLQPSKNGHGLVVQLLPPEENVLAHIRSLEDPHYFAPNQPRDRYKDSLEFPKHGAGVLCDVNFAAHLALHNTQLLRCYSLVDPRVRPMVLFVKHWAKIRGINSGYRGTLSSYGYVLMVLHYLVNVAQPFVCPNLQHLAIGDAKAADTFGEHDVSFWKDEAEIRRLAQANQLNWNRESVGSLLRGFFEYYAHSGVLMNSPARGFDWGRDVLSLRSRGGLLSKQSKGWTGAKTVIEKASPAANTTVEGDIDRGTHEYAGPSSKAFKVELKEVRLRYLFAIEDPFEREHNVARTVTHNGIVSIRDEFRRAWGIIKAASRGSKHDNLLEDVNATEQGPGAFQKLLDSIHGFV